MTLRDVTLRCVTLHYIHNTHDTHGDVICYVCVCAWACDSMVSNNEAPKPVQHENHGDCIDSVPQFIAANPTPAYPLVI
jgi:hypothetical protein